MNGLFATKRVFGLRDFDITIYCKTSDILEPAYNTLIAKKRVKEYKSFCSITDFPPFLIAVSREKLQLKIKSLVTPNLDSGLINKTQTSFKSVCLSSIMFGSGFKMWTERTF